MTVKIKVINNKNQNMKQRQQLTNTNNTSESGSEDENQIRDDEKCCVCKLFTPKEVRESPCLIFTKWLQCDQYKHWVHLVYSTEKRVIRKRDVFLCPYCKSD